MSEMVAGLLADGVAADDAGAYGGRYFGGVCHDDAVAEAISHGRSPAKWLVARVLAALLRGVCAAHVLYAADIFFLGLSAVVLR